jgi:hypothetical protein
LTMNFSWLFGNSFPVFFHATRTRTVITKLNFWNKFQERNIIILKYFT